MEVNWEEIYRTQLKSLEEFLGYIPDVKLIKDIYNFDLSHKNLQQDENKHNVFLIYVDGVKVRFIKDWYCIQVNIEGSLPAEKINILQQQLLTKLSQLQNVPCVVENY